MHVFYIWEHSVLLRYEFTLNDPCVCGRHVLIWILVPRLSSHLPKCWPRLWLLWVHSFVLISTFAFWFHLHSSPWELISSMASRAAFFLMLGVQSLVIIFWTLGFKQLSLLLLFHWPFFKKKSHFFLNSSYQLLHSLCFLTLLLAY